MIAERQNGRTVESTLTGEVVKMGIAEDAMAHIMNVLTDLYRNPIRAIVREYSTNAFDAHVEAGVKRAIEVFTPSPLSPFFRVKDHGVGLNAEDIRLIYSQYGNSTKRGTNDQVGMLGLGCKSALTYTDNFVVVSCKDGERVEVSIERTEDGTGVMKMPTVTATTDPNGTEVIVPVKAADIRKVEEEARDFFSYWQPGTVLVNGAQAKRIEGLDLHGDGSLLIVSGETDYVVMGNVAYPVEEPLSIEHGLPRQRWRSALSVVAFVPIGSVNFPPSRESLMATSKTKATLGALGGQVHKGLDAAVQREVNKAETHREAVDTLVKWTEKLSRRFSTITYKGHFVPSSFTPSATWQMQVKWGSDDTVGVLRTANRDHDYTRHDRYTALPADHWSEMLFFYGFDGRSFTVTQKKKMRKYVEDNGIQGVARFGLIASYPSAQEALWLGKENLKPWQDVLDTKLPKAESAGSSYSSRLAGSYDFYCEDGWKSGVSGDDIDQSKPIYFVHGKSYEAASYVPIYKRAHPQGFYIVALTANRIDKFCRNVPSAKRAQTGVMALWKAEAAKFSKDQLLALYLSDEGYRRWFEKLDSSKLHDPALREAVRLSKVDVTKVANVRQEFRELTTTELPDIAWKNPMDSYPLFDAVRSAHYRINNLAYSDEMYFYLNAKYAELIRRQAA